MVENAAENFVAFNREQTINLLFFETASSIYAFNGSNLTTTVAKQVATSAASTTATTAAAQTTDKTAAA
jgi:hypothetical protein